MCWTPEVSYSLELLLRAVDKDTGPNRNLHYFMFITNPRGNARLSLASCLHKKELRYVKWKRLNCKEDMELLLMAGEFFHISSRHGLTPKLIPRILSNAYQSFVCRCLQDKLFLDVNVLTINYILAWITSSCN